MSPNSSQTSQKSSLIQLSPSFPLLEPSDMESKSYSQCSFMTYSMISSPSLIIQKSPASWGEWAGGWREWLRGRSFLSTQIYYYMLIIITSCHTHPHRHYLSIPFCNILSRDLILMDGYQRCTSAQTSRWSQGCSWEGRQVLSSALSPLKQVTDPQLMLLVEMMRSLDSFTSSSALWYCACEVVRFLRVVNSNSQRGQRWKVLPKRQSVWRKELRSPPTMIWYLGRYSFSRRRSFFKFSICTLFFSALELRWTQAKMKLSAPAKAMLSAQRKFFCCSELISLEISEKSCNLAKECLLRTMRESSLGSVTMYWSDFFSSFSRRTEYSWMKKTSGFNLSKPCMNFLNFSFSSRKLILQRGASLLRKMVPSCLMASSKGMLPKTYSSSAWYMMKSYSFTVSFSSFFHSNLKLPLFFSNSFSHFSSNSFLFSSVFQKTPTVPSNMCEYLPFLKVLSILPISHLKVFSLKFLTYLGMSLRKMAEMAAMSFSQSLKQNSKGLKAMPQQLRVATEMVFFWWEVCGGSLTVCRAVSKFPI